VQSNGIDIADSADRAQHRSKAGVRKQMAIRGHCLQAC
jgi:hypothetical protein